MQLSRPDADVFVPDGTPPDHALSRTTHLCVIAHQDEMLSPLDFALKHVDRFRSDVAARLKQFGA